MPPKRNSIRNVLAALGLATVSATGQAACVGNPNIPFDAGDPSDATPLNDTGNSRFDSAVEDASSDASASDASVSDASASDASASDASASDASADAATDGG